MKKEFNINGQLIEIDLSSVKPYLERSDEPFAVVFKNSDGESSKIYITRLSSSEYFLSWKGVGFTVSEKQMSGQGGLADSFDGTVKASMPGRVLKILVQPGQDVKEGETLLVMEAMKMEMNVKAPVTGQVSEIFMQMGDTVSLGQALLTLES
jgi:oxaloacetate decarboxylase alpha subunit